MIISFKDHLHLPKVGKSLELIGMGCNFLNRTPMQQALRSKIDKLIDKIDKFVKLEIFCKAKDIANRTNWQPTDWEKVFTNSTSSREPISKIYKELKKLTTKKPNNPNLKNGV